jgi:hypothetical protein
VHTGVTKSIHTFQSMIEIPTRAVFFEDDEFRRLLKALPEVIDEARDYGNDVAPHVRHR